MNIRGPTVQQSLSLIHNTNTHTHISNVQTILDICAGLYKRLWWNKCSNIPWRHQRPVRTLRANINTIKEHSTNVHIVGYFNLFSFASVLVAGFKWPLSRVSVPQHRTRGMHEYFSTVWWFISLQIGFKHCITLLLLTWIPKFTSADNYQTAQLVDAVSVFTDIFACVLITHG